MDPKRLNAAQPAVPRNTFNTYITYFTTLFIFTTIIF